MTSSDPGGGIQHLLWMVSVSLTDKQTMCDVVSKVYYQSFTEVAQFWDAMSLLVCY